MTTNKEALNIISELTDEAFSKIKDNLTLTTDTLIKYELCFEAYIKDLVNYMWMKQNPTHFLNCFVTSDEYETNNCEGYSWHIKMLNGQFDPKNFYHVKDIDKQNLYLKYSDKEEALSIFKGRKQKLIDEIKNCDNIIMWCVNHFSI